MGTVVHPADVGANELASFDPFASSPEEIEAARLAGLDLSVRVPLVEDAAMERRQRAEMESEE